MPVGLEQDASALMNLANATPGKLTQDEREQLRAHALRDVVTGSRHEADHRQPLVEREDNFIVCQARTRAAARIGVASTSRSTRATDGRASARSRYAPTFVQRSIA